MTPPEGEIFCRWCPATSVNDASTHHTHVEQKNLTHVRELFVKRRNGAKVVKRYDAATTPHQHAIDRCVASMGFGHFGVTTSSGFAVSASAVT